MIIGERTDPLPEEGALQPGANVILCADDFAMSAGVSRGIEELALAQRLSATSAIVTLPDWERHAATLARLRGYIAVGLHLNLTLGAPLGAMPGLAPDQELPSLGALIRQSVAGRASVEEIADEIERQLARFKACTGFAPDFIDGHQHVHALPGIRRALIQVLGRRFAEAKPLVRDPADSFTAIANRRTAGPKAALIALLARGFGAQVRAAGFPTNYGFSGVSPFDLDSPFDEELECFFSVPGRRHLVMCHPGYPDAALADLDPVVARRRQELDALFAAPRLDQAIWHVRRTADGPAVDWQQVLPA